jgi:Nif-specific regulatory protein
MSFSAIFIGTEVIGALGIDLPYGSGALDYELCVPTIVAASISQALRFHQISAEEMEDLKAKNNRLQAQLRSRYRASTFVIGNSKIMRDLFLQMEQVSGTGATVLLQADCGTIKVDIRVIAATNRDLQKLISGGRGGMSIAVWGP